MRPERATLVLVHGAFHGAWCWREVAELLRRAGFRVLTPVLTGVGERSHLARRDVDLEVHITDVCQFIEHEELTDVILLGHSYASYVVAGAADRYRERISRLVYLDSYLPQPGTPFFNNIEPGLVDQLMDNLIDGYLVPAFPPEFFGIEPVGSEQWQWVRRRLTPQPVATFQQKLGIAGTGDLPVTYIRTKPEVAPVDDPVYAGFSGRPDRQYLHLPSSHDIMITAPDALARMLVTEVLGTVR